VDQVCFEGGCCDPNCAGIVCGSDECGGSCGECLPGYTCNAGNCICPITACQQATDPTNDDQESCDCVESANGQSFCIATIKCSNPIPDSCVTNEDCLTSQNPACLAFGCVCQANGCGGNPACAPLCSLG
jgi:hypothetical protein